MLWLAALLLPVLLALPARSQEPLPQPAHTSVNDFAHVLTDADTQAIDEALIALHAETGVEGTVVTLPERARYGDASLEALATRLFNTWGVGLKGRDDGFMLLLVQAEREARIELGAGYGRGADILAGDVMRQVMLPRLKAGDASAALREGTLAVISGIARPQAAGIAPAEPARSPWPLKLGVFGLFGFVGLRILQGLLGRRRAGRCPGCGGTGMQVETGPEGGAVTGRCPSCGWSGPWLMPGSVWAPDPWRRGRRSDRFGGRRGGGGGGFGGGRSGGGGASGRF